MYYNALTDNPFGERQQLPVFDTSMIDSTAAELPTVEDFAGMIKPLPFQDSGMVTRPAINAMDGIGIGLQNIGTRLGDVLAHRAQNKAYTEAMGRQMQYKHAQDLAEKQAAYNKLHAADAYLNPEQRAFNTATDGGFNKTYGTGLANNALIIPEARAKAEAAPIIGRGEGLKQVGQGQAINDAVKGFDVSGQNVADLNAYQNITGRKPVTGFDQQGQRIDLDNKNLDRQQKQIELGNLPRQQEADYQGKVLGNQNQALSNKKAEIDLKYQDALKEIDLLTSQDKLGEANEKKANLAEAQKAFEHNYSNYESMTAGQVKLFNSRMKADGMPFELPEKKEFKTVGKDSKLYNPQTGEVIKVK